MVFETKSFYLSLAIIVITGNTVLHMTVFTLGGSKSGVGTTGHAVASIPIPTYSLICVLHSYVHVLSYVHTLIVCMGSHVYTGAVLTS